MSSSKKQNPKIKEEIKTEEDIYNIKIFRRTLENNTHEVFEDTKIKKVTSWRKSKKKFFQSLIIEENRKNVIFSLLKIYMEN